jgi:hypothetical protein
MPKKQPRLLIDDQTIPMGQLRYGVTLLRKLQLRTKMWLLLEVVQAMFNSSNLSFQVSRLKLRCKRHKRSKCQFSFSLNNHKDPPNLVNVWLNLEWCLHSEHVVWSYCDTCFFYVFSLDHKPCHIPLRYRCPIKEIVHLRPHKPYWIIISFWYDASIVRVYVPLLHVT